jgi:acyl carrier protein phosphodiesterase
MNFLAHALLSPEDPEVLVGNLTADFIKGKARQALAPKVREGLALHQRIDAFTDTHHRVANCALAFEPRWGRYAAVLVDVFFDHVLARRWTEYHGETLGEFVAGVYGTLAAHRQGLPPRAQLATAYMMRDDWLGSYATIEGIRVALERMTRRLRHDIDLAPAATDLAENLGLVEGAFVPFFGELRAAVTTT